MGADGTGLVTVRNIGLGWPGLVLARVATPLS
jgi:hypothetical protein